MGLLSGAKGYVTGTHGGIEHTMAYFKAEDLERMEGNENFLIRTYGQGLKVDQTPDVFWMNIDPRLLSVMNVDVDDQGQLRFSSRNDYSSIFNGFWFRIFHYDVW